MDDKNQIRSFLMTRRARIQPEDAGLPRGARRRVQGLRREEVAALAGVSVDYYVQIERGNLNGVSDDILREISRALRLSSQENEYLFTLAREGTGTYTRKPQEPSADRLAVLEYILESMRDAPTYILNPIMDIVLANAAAQDLYADAIGKYGQHFNLVRYVFLDRDAPSVFAQWDQAADDCVAILRLNMSKFHDDQALTQLVSELYEGSAAFTSRWDTHPIRLHSSGHKTILHPDRGAITLHYESFGIHGLPGYTMHVHTPF